MGWEYADNLERKDFAFMRSDEAMLLFMGLNDLREVFGRAQIALWCSLSLDLHKMFLFVSGTISLAGSSPVVFVGCPKGAPGRLSPLAGCFSFCQDLGAAEGATTSFGTDAAVMGVV